MKRLVLAALTLTALGSGSAWATCPPLSAYQVSGVRSHTSLTQAVNNLFSDTAWTASVAPLGRKVPVQLDHVSGPLSTVLQRVVQATADTHFRVHTVADTSTCTLHVAVSMRPLPVPAAMQLPVVAPPKGKLVVTAPAATTPAPIKPAPLPPAKPYTLPAHHMLSQVLAKYVQAHEWTLQWTLPTDYTLPVAVTIPSRDAGHVIKGVEYVFHAYHARGALVHATLIFARGNHVVAVVPETATQGGHP